MWEIIVRQESHHALTSESLTVWIIRGIILIISWLNWIRFGGLFQEMRMEMWLSIHSLVYWCGGKLHHWTRSWQVRYTVSFIWQGIISLQLYHQCLAARMFILGPPWLNMGIPVIILIIVIKWIHDVFNLLLGIFKLLNKSQPLDVPALQQIITKLDSSLDEVSTHYLSYCV